MAQHLFGTALTRQMEPDIAPPPLGAAMVAQKSTSIRDLTNRSKVTMIDRGSSIGYSSISKTDHGMAIDHALSSASSNTRLDAATADRLLSAVAPTSSKNMGLGITFDVTPFSAGSTKSPNTGSLRNSKVRSFIDPTME